MADLLFPWFMWMMGVSMALSYSNLDKKAQAEGLGSSEHSKVLCISHVLSNLLLIYICKLHWNTIEGSLDKSRKEIGCFSRIRIIPEQWK